MGKYVIHRNDDDYYYDISADTLEELRELRSENNHCFINKYYPSTAETYDKVEKRYRYFNVVTGAEVDANGKPLNNEKEGNPSFTDHNWDI